MEKNEIIKLLLDIPIFVGTLLQDMYSNILEWWDQGNYFNILILIIVIYVFLLILYWSFLFLRYLLICVCHLFIDIFRFIVRVLQLLLYPFRLIFHFLRKHRTHKVLHEKGEYILEYILREKPMMSYVNNFCSSVSPIFQKKLSHKKLNRDVIKDYLEKEEGDFAMLFDSFRELYAISKIPSKEIPSRVEDIDKMSDKDFEKTIARHYDMLGYNTQAIGGPGDQGVDVVVRGRENMVIQCKRYALGNKVGSGDLQKIGGATRLQKYKGFHPALITNSHVTEKGKKYAREASIKIMEREELFSHLRETIFNNKYHKVFKAVRDINFETCSFDDFRLEENKIRCFKNELARLLKISKQLKLY